MVDRAHVSVILCAYELPRDAVESALASVAAQTNPVAEAIFVDDGSDPPIELPEREWPFRLEIVRHPTNRGKPAALNTGVALARGDLLSFLDADDEWLMDKLARQLTTWWRVRKYACAVTCGRLLAGHSFRTPRIREALRMVPYAHLIRGNLSGWSGILVPRDSYLDVGGGVPHGRRTEDWDFLLRLSAATGLPIAVMSDKLFVYNYSRSSPESARSSLAVFRRWADASRKGDAPYIPEHILARITQMRLLSFANVAYLAGWRDEAYNALRECATMAVGSLRNAVFARLAMACPWLLTSFTAYRKMLKGQIPFRLLPKDSMWRD